jgi:MFS family permease
MLLLVLILFTVGSIVCAVANNFIKMLVGRSIQDTEDRDIIALTEILITDTILLRERDNYFALISIV